jgi:hypothetical protein
LRHALHDQIDDGTAGGPGQHTQAIAIANGPAGHLLQNVQWLIDEKLIQPFDELDVHGLIKAKC